MSVTGKAQITRRPLLKVLAGGAVVAVAGAALWEAPKFLASRHPASPYDDLLAQLPDRENAIRIGAAFLGTQPGFDAVKTAQALREKLASHNLQAVLENELAKAQVGEAHGWVLPQTLIALCALAAKAG
ncbi:MAG TPA: hypothetical protein VGK90_03360 [Rhizomicrobium sp.]|jgi:hypothetical protein